MAAITLFWVRSSVVMMLTIELDPAGAAGIFSGMARLKAPKIKLRRRAQVRLRMPTAAGKTGIQHRSFRHDAGERPRQPGIEQEMRIERVKHVVDANEQERVSRVASGGHVKRGSRAADRCR